MYIVREQIRDELLDSEVWWSFERGETRAEIAERLGLSLRTVDRRLRRARERWGLPVRCGGEGPRRGGDEVGRRRGDSLLEGIVLGPGEGENPAAVLLAENVWVLRRLRDECMRAVKLDSLVRMRQAAGKVEVGEGAAPAGPTPMVKQLMEVMESLRRHAELALRVRERGDPEGELDRFKRMVMTVLREVDPKVLAEVKRRLTEGG